MYSVSLIMPSTEEGIKYLEDKLTETLAKITIKKLSTEELEMLIAALKSGQL